MPSLTQTVSATKGEHPPGDQPGHPAPANLAGGCVLSSADGPSGAVA
jgi:hypothetical protein